MDHHGFMYGQPGYTEVDPTSVQPPCCFFPPKRSVPSAIADRSDEWGSLPAVRTVQRKGIPHPHQTYRWNQVFFYHSIL